MTSPLINFDIDVNFWDNNTQLKLVKAFNEIWEEDKTKKKKNSSQIMWAIALCYDPESKYIKWTEEDRRKLVEDDFIHGKIDWRKYENAIKTYIGLYTTQAERSLMVWEKKLKERDDYLTSKKYSEVDLKDAKALDDLLANTPKLYSQYNMILEQLDEEQAKAKTKGNAPESASEKKEI